MHGWYGLTMTLPRRPNPTTFSGFLFYVGSSFTGFLLLPLSYHTTLSVLCMRHWFLYHRGGVKGQFLLFEMFSPPPSCVCPIWSFSHLFLWPFNSPSDCVFHETGTFPHAIISQCLSQCRCLINTAAWLNEWTNKYILPWQNNPNETTISWLAFIAILSLEL